MARTPQIREAKLTRSRHGERTLCFTTPHLPTPRSRRCRLTFIKPEHVPDFDGEEAWFELELVEARPWSYWRALRQVELAGALARMVAELLQPLAKSA